MRCDPITLGNRGRFALNHWINQFFDRRHHPSSENHRTDSTIQLSVRCLHNYRRSDCVKNERTEWSKKLVSVKAGPFCRENFSTSDCTILFFLTRVRKRTEREEEWPLAWKKTSDWIMSLWEVALHRRTCFLVDLTRRDREKRDEQLRSQDRCSAESAKDARGLPSWPQLNLLEWSELPHAQWLAWSDLPDITLRRKEKERIGRGARLTVLTQVDRSPCKSQVPQRKLWAIEWYFFDFNRLYPHRDRRWESWRIAVLAVLIRFTPDEMACWFELPDMG